MGTQDKEILRNLYRIVLVHGIQKPRHSGARAHLPDHYSNLSHLKVGMCVIALLMVPQNTPSLCALEQDIGFE